MEHPIFPLSPRRLINLADMIKFLAEDLVHSWHWLLGECGSTYAKSSGKQYVELEFYDKNRINGLLDLLHKLATQLEMEKTLERVKHFKNQLNISNVTPNFHAVNAELMGLQTCYWKDIKSRLFAYIPAQNAKLFENDSPFGSEFNVKFSAAKQDARDAANCLAIELNTAAVFHLMRIAECGLHSIAKPLIGKGIKGDITYDTWGQVLGKMNEKLAKYRKPPMTKNKEEKLIYYSDLILHVKAFMHLWRNPVSHWRGDYNDGSEAPKVFNHVRDFMHRLSIKK